MPTKTNPTFSGNQPRIFLSYARKDGEDFARDLRRKFEAHHLSVWQDRIKIEGAKKWWAQIEEAINKVEYMVLVVTKAALKSMIVQREWKFARQEGKGVIPVIGSEDLDFDNMPRWMKAEHFVDTTHLDQWRRILRTLEGPHQSIHVKYVEEKLPDNFIARPKEFEPLLKELVNPVRGEAVAITATLQGAGGFGKTTLARALCHHPTIKDTYFDGIHWVTIGETPGDLTGRVLDLIERISGQRSGFETLERAGDRLAELLAEHFMLIVIDDVWDSTHLKPFLKGGSNCTRLITTRNQKVIPPNTKSVVVDRMDNDEAVALLKRGLPDGQEERLPGLAKRLGHWPLLLNLVASALREECKGGASVSGAIDYIEEGMREEGLTAFDVNNVEDRNLAVEATINVSLRRLAESSRERFEELSIFPEDTKIPIRVVEVYWKATGGLTSFQVNKTIRELFGFSLLWALNLEEQCLQLHDVFRGYLRSKKKNELWTLQTLFLDTWKGNKAWHTLSKTEPYIWHHLAWHLIEAGRQKELESLLLDFPWLKVKLDTTDPAALLKDFDYVKGNDAVEKVSGAVRLSAHILGQDTTQLPSQLVGRLKAVKHSEVQSFLSQVQEYSNHPWLQPLQGSLIAPGGPLIRTLSGHSGGVEAVTVTPDGMRAISASGDETCKVWDLATGQERLTLSGHSRGVEAVTVTPDGTRAISASGDETCKVWDLATGQERLTLSGHSGEVQAMTVMPDGMRAISASRDQTCKVWDLATGHERLTLSGHSGGVEAVTVTPDGTRAISTSRDQTCKVWDLGSAKQVATFTGESPMICCAISPEGRTIVIGESSGRVHFLRLEGIG